MGSVDKRIEALERSYGPRSAAGEHNPERERLIEELEALRPAFEEKMAAEEARGDFRRRRALEELEEVVRRRTQRS